MLRPASASYGMPADRRTGVEDANAPTPPIRGGVVETIRSDPFEVRRVLADISAQLLILGFRVDDVGTIEIVLAETLNNIVEHAYGEDRDGQIELCLEPNADGLDCRVTDSGRPMPFGVAPAGAPADLGPTRDGLPEGGFGWFLIRELSRDLVYQRIDGCNCLEFRFDFSAPKW